jgi:hypothetical protein
MLITMYCAGPDVAINFAFSPRLDILSASFVTPPSAAPPEKSLRPGRPRPAPAKTGALDRNLRPSNGAPGDIITVHRHISPTC